MHILAQFVDFIGEALILIIIIQSILTWFIRDPHHKLHYYLRRVTDPILSPIRRFMPDLGGLDISPVIAIIGLSYLKKIIINLIYL